MKYNLKNRPKPKFDMESPYCGDWLRVYTEWFEGFQKELEHKLEITSIKYINKRILIKEILGEM